MKRRDFLKTTAVSGAAVVAAPSFALAEDKKGPVSKNKFTLEQSLESIMGKKTAKMEGISLTAPDIAENGAVVPVKVEVDSPMTKDNYVKAIHVIAEKNQNSRVLSVFLTPKNGGAYLSTRIKLGESQKVIIIAELSNGEFKRAEKEVKVTIGGCG